MPLQKDNWNDHWDNYGDSSEINPAVIYRQNYLKKLLGKFDTNPNYVLLDIGCGTGAFLHQLEKEKPNYRLIGLEPSASGCERARTQTHATIIEGDVLNLSSLTDELFQIADIGVCSEVIEHVDDPVLFLRECKQLLKPTGVIIITVPGGFRSAYDKHIGHRQHYSKRQLMTTLLNAGYKDVRVYRAGFPIFNFYKLLTILAGRKLISAVSSSEQHGDSKLTILISALFNKIFRFSLPNFPLGWQLVATASLKE